jgi:hypothetical protein
VFLLVSSNMVVDALTVNGFRKLVDERLFQKKPGSASQKPNEQLDRLSRYFLFVIRVIARWIVRTCRFLSQSQEIPQSGPFNLAP